MLKTLKKNEKGLTLIELLAVLVIVGIIAAIAIPAIGGTISSSKSKADAATRSMIEEATLRYSADKLDTITTPTHEVTLAILKSEGYISGDPKWNDSAKTITTCTVTIATSAVTCNGTTATPAPTATPAT
ncbi:prepilin-type N-terminal cleavage/methylation domain-containing protein [Paenibacillus sp. strain BS8-2]